MAVAVSETWQPSPSADAAELVDPVASARAAGLRYVSDQSPGLRRKRAGKGFTYVDSGGSPLPGEEKNQKDKARCAPPPRTQRWIVANPRALPLPSRERLRSPTRYRT